MGATRNTGYLENLIQYDASDNVAIATSVNPSYKVTLGGSMLGTSAVFSSTITSSNEFRGLNGYGIRSYTAATATGNNILFAASVFASFDGIYQSSGSTNDFGIWTNGGTINQPKFVIKNGGNVGIGTTSPDLALTVNGAINMRNSTRAGAFEIDASGNLWIGTATTAGNIYLETGHSTTGLPSTGTARLTLNQSGATFSSSVTTGGDIISTKSVGFTLKTTTVGAWTAVYGDTGGLYLGTNAGNWMFINNSGNVGIGTTDPQTILNDFSTNARGVAISNAYPMLGFSDTDGGKFFIGTQGNIGYVWNNGTDSLIFGNNGAERMRITSGGLIGINATNPFNFGSGSGMVDVRSQNTSAVCGVFISNSDRSASIVNYINNAAGAFIGTSTSHYLDIGTSDTGRIRITHDGYISLNSIVYGTTTAGTTRTLYIGNNAGLYYIGGISSIRESKKNINPISNVNWLYSLNPVTFNYRKKDADGNFTDEFYDEINYGLIAEEAATVANFLVNYDENSDGTKKMLGIEYPRLIVPLLKAIQEQQAQIEELKSKLS